MKQLALIIPAFVLGFFTCILVLGVTQLVLPPPCSISCQDANPSGVAGMDGTFDFFLPLGTRQQQQQSRHDGSTTVIIKAKVQEGKSSKNGDSPQSSSSSSLLLHHGARLHNNVHQNHHPYYGKYCDHTILGERQTPWNKNKKILSFSLFNPAAVPAHKLDGNNSTTASSSTSPPEMKEILPWVSGGIEIQAELAKLYYPDWILRLHTVGLSLDWEYDILKRHDNVEIVHCIPFHTNARMMLHRLLAHDDPNVLYTLVRDVDSRFTLRELMAVNEWLGASMTNLNGHSHYNQTNHNHTTTTFDFHVMRDHNHHLWPVMGGTLGMKRGMFGNNGHHNTTMKALLDQALRDHPTETIPGYAGEDQAFLALYVWPRIQNVTMAHDMRSHKECMALGSKECRDFPLGPRFQGNGSPYYVGAQFKPRFQGAVKDSRGPQPKLCF